MTSANIGGDTTTTSYTPSAGLVFTQAALAGTLHTITTNVQMSDGWLEPSTHERRDDPFSGGGAARYIAAGCDGAHGLPTRAEIVALLALTPAERLAWAREVADAFAAQMPVGSDGTPHVIEDYQDVGSVVWVAADFLTETSRRQPWAGQCYWLVDDVPDVPHVLSVDDHGDSYVAVIHYGTHYAHVPGATEDEARTNAEARIAQEAKS